MRLKSFTLIELLVALVISGVVMLLAFWFLSNTHKYLYSEGDNLASQNEALGFINRIERDIESADYIDYKQHRIRIVESDSIRSSYLFEESFIVRETDERSDTMFAYVSAFDTTCLYNKKGLIIIKDIIFSVELNKQTIPLHFHKDYYSRFLLYLEGNN